MSFTARPYILAETNWKNIQDTQYDFAVLPWGATEAHNFHLPYATDNYQADYIAAASAQLAWAQGARPLVMPCIPFGVNTGQLDIDFCMNLNPSTQYAIIQDVAEVITRHGIDKLVLFNGHGGNHFKQMIRELSVDYPELFVCAINWYQAIDQHLYFDDLGDHAGEMETSAMMHIAPQFVLPLSEAGDGQAKRFKIAALNEGWASTPRAWTQVTADTGVGNPAKASAEKGAKYLEATALKISEFFVELAKADIHDLYA
ncbi:MAG: creatininase family protein [Bacteroidota bacterium]